MVDGGGGGSGSGAGWARAAAVGARVAVGWRSAFFLFYKKLFTES
jgi:hypothetical protein